ncbi:OmpA family protein [Cryomorpha ignava]|uniref:OmpA family protein n=1 Tax=Cryomorpha ignava TaxID=101383 RepID=A0A7K3WPI7_9FLAO|nr:OmpA family protein [Cryomorpha ignava]NEN22802.1 OmpA family protein [Cryomorpha ignava]
MKFQMLASALGVLLLSSCATVYKCGEPRPEKFSANKKVTALVDERDSLCTTLEEVKNENSALETNLAEKKESLAALESEYNNLKAKSSQTAEELSAELVNRARMLSEREARINEMQSEIARRDSITARLNNILRDALLGFKDDELTLEVKNGKVYVSMTDKLLFKSGSAAVEEKGKEAIEALGNVLAKNPDIDVLIEGHTDNVPIKTASYKDNWDLSVARATSIVRLLADKHDLDEKRLTAAGRGEFQPRATNDTQDGRAQNRRTEIILSPKLDELMNLLGQ